MRILFIITCLANIALAFGSLLWMPDQIAVHFTLDGRANRFEPPIANAVMMSVLIGIMGAVVLGVSFPSSQSP